MRFYFGESVGDMTMPILKSRVTMLRGGGDEGGGNAGSAAAGDAMAKAAGAIMSKTGRKSVSLNEVLGVI